jgi:hypothetical protein
MSDEDDAVAEDAIGDAARDSGLFSDLAEWFDEPQPFGADGVIGGEETAEEVAEDAPRTFDTGGMITAEDTGEDLADDAPRTFPTRPMLPGYAESDLRNGVVYLDETEREEYALSFENGKIYDADGNPFDTGDGHAIWVMDKDGTFYAANDPERNVFQHSSFLSGEPAAATGEVKTSVPGEVEWLSDKGQHYSMPRPYTYNAINELTSTHGVDFDVDTQMRWYAARWSP